MGDEPAVEAAFRAERHHDWEEDLLFYRGQKEHPQLYTIGAVHLRLAAKEQQAAFKKRKERPKKLKAVQPQPGN